jgi:hypothetical protein
MRRFVSAFPASLLFGARLSGKVSPVPGLA